jgi:hypothetical protein
VADLEKVRGGQPFKPPAEDWNAFIDAARAERAGRLSEHADGELFDQSATVVQVKNETGELQPRMRVLGVFDSVHDPQAHLDTFKNEIVLRGRIPLDGEDRGRFVILKDSLAPDMTGEAVIAGVTAVQVCLGSESHEFADIDPGLSTHLKSGSTGSAQILYLGPPCGSPPSLRWCVVRLGNKTGAATGTTTTTTADPNLVDQATCSGRCKWTWSASLLEWQLDDDACGPTTTSTTAAPTSSTTTDPATSTTAEPSQDNCICPTTTTGDPATSTTTTAAPCQCLYPTYCGTSEGECTYTYCSQGMNEPPECGGTTTTTTSTTTGDPATSTTTTTCDCNTTTTSTQSPECTDCVWACFPVSDVLRRWTKVEDGCNFSYKGCSCMAPPLNVDCPLCATTRMPCVTTAAPGTTEPPSCGGACTYWWIEAAGVAGWKKTFDSCGGTPTCRCQPPSEPGDGCGPVVVPCSDPSATTTTTADPATSTTPVPCSSCYPTTTTTTSTTTVATCSQVCKWQATEVSESLVWSNVDDPCPGSCPCVSPAYQPTDGCETAVTRCGGGTTTTTSTTTTTTAAPWYCWPGPGGSCNVQRGCIQASSPPPGACSGPYTQQADCTAICGFGCTCDGGGCTGEEFASNICSPRYFLMETCQAFCATTTTTTTTTTAAPTTTTTTEAPETWYCQSGILQGCGSPGASYLCATQLADDPGDRCPGGPYASHAECIANCPPSTSTTTTTTTTTAAPSSTTTTTTTTSSTTTTTTTTTTTSSP